MQIKASSVLQLFCMGNDLPAFKNDTVSNFKPIITKENISQYFNVHCCVKWCGDVRWLHCLKKTTLSLKLNDKMFLAWSFGKRIKLKEKAALLWKAVETKQCHKFHCQINNARGFLQLNINECTPNYKIAVQLWRLLYWFET